MTRARAGLGSIKIQPLVPNDGGEGVSPCQWQYKWLSFLEFHRLSLTAIADPPHTLTTAFTERNLLSDRGSASGFDAHTIFRNSGFHLLFEQTAFIETKLHSLDGNAIQLIRSLLSAWISVAS
jgi:hypothetical protein